jgi:hypothetical protein
MQKLSVASSRGKGNRAFPHANSVGTLQRCAAIAMDGLLIWVKIN